jgi:hypothetical protein
LKRLLDQTIGKVSKFEEEKKAEFNQTLMTYILQAATEHFKNIRVTKALARGGEISHQGFHEASRPYTETFERIRVAFAPVSLSDEIVNNVRLELIGLVSQEQSGGEKLTLERIIQSVKDHYFDIHHIHLDIDADQRQKLQDRNEKGSSLLEMIKEESLTNLRESSAYTPAVKAILSLLFPNKEHDLDFIPEKQRPMIYELLKTMLLPTLLQNMMGIILQPDMINTLVLSTLQLGVDSLQAPIDPPVKDAPKEPDPNPELKQAAGELLEQLLPMVTLPKILKDQVVDSKGHLYPEMKKTLGSFLMRQLTDYFIQDKLKMVVEMAVAKQIFNYHAQPGAKVTEADLKKTSRELVSAGISYTIRSKWAEAQARFDWAIEEYCGKIGMTIKHALDKVFEVIFFKIIGSILWYTLYPVQLLLKDIIYRVIDLDKNREAILGPLTKKPADQPQADYVVYNEDLVYRLGKALEEAVKKVELSSLV